MNSVLKNPESVENQWRKQNKNVSEKEEEKSESENKRLAPIYPLSIRQMRQHAFK